MLFSTRDDDAMPLLPKQEVVFQSAVHDVTTLAQATSRYRTALQQVLSSREFAHAERLRSFLRYVVEASLEGRQTDLKEYAIALAVCGRRATFDPKCDAIVRVDANRLRARLDVYYQSKGAADAIRIALPRGSYEPEFHDRETEGYKSRTEVAGLAVVPFASLGLEAERERLGDGLTQEVLHRLSCITGLKVVVPGSELRRHKEIHVEKMLNGMGVRLALTGSVRLAANRLRILIQLIDVATSQLLWSQIYEYPPHDTVQTQEIASSIANDVLARFSDPSQVPIGIAAPAK